jgi:hypothetical protein
MSGSKARGSFLKKRTKKLFIGLTRPSSERSAQAFESLLLLFFRKEDLASMSHALLTASWYYTDPR